ncbi:MAG: hypothetical protein AAFN27_13525 [Pseudomonadota bacterium]
MLLIGTLAHEAPGGTEFEELNTDLHVITMGLGVIEMLAAKAAGWMGYMRQPTRAHALATFVAVLCLDIGSIKQVLPPRAVKYVGKAWERIMKNSDENDRLRRALIEVQI